MSKHLAARQRPNYSQSIRRHASRMLKFSIVLPLFLTIMFPLVYGFSMHSPTPHHLKVAVIGGDAKGQALAMKLDARAGDQYDVVSASSVADAEHQLKDLEIRAAWDPKTNTTYVASMGSTSATQFAEAYFQKAAPKVLQAEGVPAKKAEQPPQVKDLVPPPEVDGLGMSLMFMGLPALMAGYMLAMGLRGNLARLRARTAIAIMAVAALFFATVPMFVAYGVYGAFATQALPIYGLLALGSFIFMLFHTGGMRLIGLYMALPTMLVLILLGIPSSGAGMATELVPPFMAAFHHWLPTPALLDALRRLLYFPDASISADVVTLMLWFFLAVILLLASFLRRPRPGDADAVPAEKVPAGDQSAVPRDPEVGSAEHPGEDHESRRRSIADAEARQGFLATFGTRRVVTEEQMENRRGLVHAFKLPLMFVLLMPLMYIGIMHAPSPNDMHLDVVVTDDASQKVADELKQLPESSYRIQQVDSVHAAREDILHDRARAAYVPNTASADAAADLAGHDVPRSGPLALVASGNGLQSEKAATQLFSSLTPDQKPGVVDLSPTGDNDRFGMSLIYLGLGGIVGSNLAGMMIGLAGRGWSWVRRICWIVGVAAANTVAQYVISVWVVQFLPQDTRPEVWAILFLMSVSIQFFATGGALLVKNTVNLFTIGIFVMCGVPASGLFLPLDLAPERYTWLHHMVPSSAALGAIRTQVYLPEAPIAGSVITELIWLLVGIGVYVWGSAHVARQRRKDHQRAEAEESQFDDSAPGEFEASVLTGSPGPQTEQLKIVRARRREKD